MVNNFLLVDEKDIEFVWETTQKQQIIFHPEYAPYGVFDYTQFLLSKRKKPFILCIDRNILISLLKFCKNGFLKDEKETRLVGLIMAWSDLNQINISSGFAIQERATQIQNQEKGLIELQKFFEIINNYPTQMWLQVAKGAITKIPPIDFTFELAKDITVDYSDGGDHYDMALVSLLRMIQLYRNKSLKPVEKFIEFFKWTCENLLISEYMLVYAILLFTEQENIKAPKNANSNSFDKIYEGCRNQAWDITHLTHWSTIYSYPENYDEEILFATNDDLLKRIFINRNGPNGWLGVLNAAFSKKDYNKIYDLVEEKIQNRIKPDFGPNHKEYFLKLIEKEKKQISYLL